MKRGGFINRSGVVNYVEMDSVKLHLFITELYIDELRSISDKSSKAIPEEKLKKMESTKKKVLSSLGRCHLLRLRKRSKSWEKEDKLRLIWIQTQLGMYFVCFIVDKIYTRCWEKLEDKMSIEKVTDLYDQCKEILDEKMIPQWFRWIVSLWVFSVNISEIQYTPPTGLDFWCVSPNLP